MGRRLSPADLKQYIRIVYELETSAFQQEELIRQLRGSMSSLGRYKNIAKPEGAKTYSPLLIAGCVWSVYTGLALLIGCFIPYKLGMDSYEGSPFYWLAVPLVTITQALMSGVGIFGLLIRLLTTAFVFASVLASPFCLIILIGHIFGVRHSKKEHLQSMQSYNRARQNDNNRVERENQKRALIQKNINVIQQQLNKTYDLLDDAYALDVIYPKYRYFVAISSFYDYLQAGRCSMLEGHEGAYNIFETEARLDHIITQLDTVIYQLDRIRDNQYMLYNAIQDSNQKNYQLFQQANAQLNNLNQSAAIAAHESNLARKELTFRNQMDMLSGRLHL